MEGQTRSAIMGSLVQEWKRGGGVSVLGEWISKLLLIVTQLNPAGKEDGWCPILRACTGLERGILRGIG